MFSFREKSLWVSLLASLVIASIYGDNIVSFLIAGESVTSQDISALILRVVIAFVVLEVALHIALAMDDQEGADMPEDEREQGYRLKANDLGYWVLSIGVISCVVQQMINSYIDVETSTAFGRLAIAPIELKLVVIFWMSEMSRFAAEIYFYRKER